MASKRFNFSEYTMDELEYVRDTLLKAMDMWSRAEIALCDAHIRHDTEPTLNDWTDLFNALKEAEKAIEDK